MNRKQSSQVTMGVVLVAVGLILLGDQLGLSVTWNIGRLWPLVLIVLGAARVASPHQSGASGYMLFLIGVIFLLHTFDYMTLDQSLSILFGRRNTCAPRKEAGHAD
jgi:hypothetical protein